MSTFVDHEAGLQFRCLSDTPSAPILPLTAVVLPQSNKRINIVRVVTRPIIVIYRCHSTVAT